MSGGAGPDSGHARGDWDAAEARDAGPEALAGRLLEGEARALSRAISWVEDEVEGFERLLDAVQARVGRARRVGVTGPPGSGKSTLTAALARHWLEAGHSVGVLAVDPTSPFTGGALLGDRVRMTDLATRPGVFIRSMASRGSVGGLATASREAADLMDAFGFDRVVLETVGVGQSELDVAGSADSTVVVLVPESGDGIQAMKAGLMEVADLFVVNKADRPGAPRLEREIQVMMSIRRGQALRGVPATHHGRRVGEVAGPKASGGGPGAGGPGGSGAGEGTKAAAWTPPVLRTTASEGEGVEALAEALDRHWSHLVASGEGERRRRAGRLERTRAALLRSAEGAAAAVWRARREEVRRALEAGDTTPYREAERLRRELATGLAEATGAEA